MMRVKKFIALCILHMAAAALPLAAVAAPPGDASGGVLRGQAPGDAPAGVAKQPPRQWVADYDPATSENHAPTGKVTGRAYSPVEIDGWFFGPIAHAALGFTDEWRTEPGGAFVGACVGTAIPWVSNYIDLDGYVAAGLYTPSTQTARDAYEAGLLYRLQALETARWSLGAGWIREEPLNTPRAWFVGAGLIKDF